MLNGKMKRKLLVAAMWLGIVCAGCGAKEPEVQQEESVVSEEAVEEIREETISSQEAEEQVTPEEDLPKQDEKDSAEPEQVDDLSIFEELSKCQFWYSSGAGGWGEEFVIEKDGCLRGKCHDSDMGDNGEGYENGTIYFADYSGRFTEVEKVDEYTYRMKLADMEYKNEVGTEEIVDGTRYVYTESFALGENDMFYVYMPGTPVSGFSEDVWMWLRSGNESETELTMIAIVDEKNGHGICSYERMSPVEDARMNYDSYKESYDYYSKKASEGMTTLEMRESASQMYEVSDECLNYLWQIIRYNVEEAEYDEILTQQREWIRKKEETAAAVKEEWGQGTLGPVIYMDTLAEMTMERCAQLLAYIENHMEE
ncbi:MAG: DUF1311 domain-containing protein [Lachnospiraceae bacterium]|nr:DUF1311 domain-containing protein [Lachnospiraceae bacterium]